MQRYPGETCAEVKARSSRQRQARRAKLHAGCAALLALPARAALLRHLEKPHVKFFLRVLAPEQFCFPGRTYVECY